jgi:NAD(P)-dependent dehydrogenase (short-subunit alcohol dehydrogenase family)
MPGRLENKVTIITGAASGQGKTAARVFAQEGAHLVLTDMDVPGLEAVADAARAAGAKVATHSGDLTDEETNRELVDVALSELGRLDVIYTNAGRVRMAPIHEATLEDWNFSVENELTIVFLNCKYAVRAMMDAGSGSIINVASSSGLFGVPGHGVHAATKAGVIGLSRQIAVEYGPRGIRCNAIAPSFIDFGLETESARGRQGSTPVTGYPLGRHARPEDPVNLAVYLASDDSSFVTGQVFLVDGGKSAR